MFSGCLRKIACLVVVGEGLIDKDGNYVANSTDSQDAFGHQQLSSYDFLANYIESNLSESLAPQSSEPEGLLPLFIQDGQ